MAEADKLELEGFNKLPLYGDGNGSFANQNSLICSVSINFPFTGTETSTEAIGKATKVEEFQ